MRSDDVVKALIGNMGEILEIEEDVLCFGHYRRVKVMLDTTKPLRRYRKLRDKKGKENYRLTSPMNAFHFSI